VFRQDLSLVTFQWFFALFVDVVDADLTLRLWDRLLLEGRPALFRFAIALLKMFEIELCQVANVRASGRVGAGAHRVLLGVPDSR
jgi:hypothetical protein